MAVDYKLYDKIVATTLVNFMIEDNRNYGIALSPFNFNDINYLYGFEVALILSQSIHKKFYIDLGLIDYWKFKLNNWSVRKSFKKYGNRVSVIPLELNKILDYMRDELSLDENIYNQVYTTYYKSGVKNRSIYKWKHDKKKEKEN